MCAIFGVGGSNISAQLVKSGLIALQHRGQDGCGIAINSLNHGIMYSKNFGWVNQVFGKESEYFMNIECNAAIGHNRYSTSNKNLIYNDLQPLYKQNIAIAHNGHIHNTDRIKSIIDYKFATTTDSEVILSLLHPNNLLDTVRNIYQSLKGAFSLLILTNKYLVACRDKFGFRPLFMVNLDKSGDSGSEVVFSSEDSALPVNSTNIRMVKPGEIIVYDIDKKETTCHQMENCNRFCSFEHIYISRPDTKYQNNETVYNTRQSLGRKMAQQDNVNADIVIPVPESGYSYAIGYSKEKGIPLELVLNVNRYVGRSFINLDKDIVLSKFSTVDNVINGKSVVVVDDSIVRGNVIKTISQLLKNAGAKEIHYRACSPPIKNICKYGVDILTKEELVANTEQEENMAATFGINSVRYLSMDTLQEVLGPNHCFACFNGEYPDAE